MKLSLKTLLNGSFVGLLSLVIVLSCVGIGAIQWTGSLFNHYQDKSHHLAIVSSLREEILMVRIQAIKYFSQPVAKHVDNYALWRDKVADSIARAQGSFLDTAAQNTARKLAALFDEYTAAFEQLTKLDARFAQLSSTERDNEEKDYLDSRERIIEGKLNTIGPEMAAILSTLKDNIVQAQTQLGKKADTIQTLATTIAWVFAIIAVILGVVAAVVIPKNIFSTVGGEPKEIEKIAIDVAQGKLNTASPSRTSRSGIYAALLSMSAALKRIIHDINTTSEGAHDVAEELQSSAIQTAKDAEQQMHLLTQVATAMEQMTATIEHVAKSTEEAANAAENATVTTQEGVGSVRATDAIFHSLITKIREIGDTVNRLSSRASDMNSILNTIDEIAEQTNLLALNAAIEAARAGEQGRGFAVVADEVRALATRTQQSTEDIQKQLHDLIEDSTRSVELMALTAREASQTEQKLTDTKTVFDTIRQSIETIASMTQQVASSSEQQEAVSKEINQLVVKVNAMSNATYQEAQRNAKQALTMSEMATGLKQQCAFFTIE